MKLFPGLSILLLFLSCKNQTVNIDSQEEAADSIYYPYSPTYTNGYKPGNNKNLKIVTDIWKEFENGDIKKSANAFADEINYVFPDLVLRGPKDSVLTEIKKIRDSYQSVQTFIYSWLPVKAKDHNDDWVFIWGKHYLTDKSGKLQIKEVHEIWQFNEEGKIKYVQQYQTMHI